MLDDLAKSVASGNAQHREELARQTIGIAKAVVMDAVRNRQLPYCEMEDAAMMAVEKAFENLGKWDSTKARWSTYVGIIAKTQILLRKEAHKKQLKARIASLENWNNLNDAEQNLADEITAARKWDALRKKNANR